MNKAVFLDRDGVINKNMPEHEYVTNWSEFELLPDVVSALKIIKEKGYISVVISNQRGVARGKMTLKDVIQIHQKLNITLSEHNVFIDAFYVCPHMGDEEACDCRKPKPGLVLKAQKDLNIDLNNSWFIGDTDADMGCARNAGVKSVRMETDSSLLDTINRISL